MTISHKVSGLTISLVLMFSIGVSKNIHADEMFGVDFAIDNIEPIDTQEVWRDEIRLICFAVSYDSSGVPQHSVSKEVKRNAISGEALYEDLINDIYLPADPYGYVEITVMLVEIDIGGDSREIRKFTRMMNKILQYTKARDASKFTREVKSKNSGASQGKKKTGTGGKGTSMPKKPKTGKKVSPIFKLFRYAKRLSIISNTVWLAKQMDKDDILGRKDIQLDSADLIYLSERGKPRNIRIQFRSDDFHYQIGARVGVAVIEREEMLGDLIGRDNGVVTGIKLPKRDPSYDARPYSRKDRQKNAKDDYVLGLFEGHFRNGDPHGPGKFIIDEGRRFFVGNFLDGYRDGDGMLINLDAGDCFYTKYKKGIIIGSLPVSCVPKDFGNRVYIGQLQSGKPNGSGLVIYDNENMYLGTFKNGRRDRHGLFFHAEGRIERQRYHNGAPVTGQDQR